MTTKSVIVSVMIVLLSLTVISANETAMYGETDSGDISLSINNGYLNNQYDKPRVIYNGDGNYINSYWVGYLRNPGIIRDGGRYGHSVHLNTPDDNPFIIGKIGIASYRSGIDGYTRIQIIDDNYVIYSQIIRDSDYSLINESKWKYISIPNVKVNNEFIIEIYTGSSNISKVYICMDGDNGNCGSYLTNDGNKYWNIDRYARCDVNWMICAVEATDEPGYNEGYTDGYNIGMAEAISNEVIGDVTGDGKVNICDGVLLFNWVSYPNERGTTYKLR